MLCSMQRHQLRLFKALLAQMAKLHAMMDGLAASFTKEAILVVQLLMLFVVKTGLNVAAMLRLAVTKVVVLILTVFVVKVETVAPMEPNVL